MKIATWNVNGIRARMAEFTAWVERDQPDVICLQEIKASPEQIGEALTLLPDYHNYWHGSGGYSGVSLHLRKSTFATKPEFSHPAFDHETRIVEAKVDGLVFASVYVPNGGKDFPAKMRFLEAMESYIKAHHATQATLVLCGDLNVARTDKDVYPSQRKQGTIGQLPDERAWIEKFMTAGLTDVGRSLEPDNQALFTWWPYWRDCRKRNAGWRLDYVLISTGRALTPRECIVLREVGTSDHGPVVATVDRVG